MAKDNFKPKNHVDPVTRKDDDQLGSIRDISKQVDKDAAGKGRKC